MQGITFSGLGSGLDTASIIDQLVALERIPINQIEAQKQTTQQKLNLIGTFKGLVKGLQSAAQDLAAQSSFLSFTVQASIDGVASISASGSATAGTHSLEVLQLAATDRWAFDGVATRDTALSGSDGQITFDVNGESFAVDVVAADSSLDDIAAAINDQAGDAVAATVVNAGTSAAPSYQLVLTSRETGEEASIANLATTIGALTFDGTVGGTSNITVGSNALAIIDGLTVERESNSFSDVLAGIDIDLQSISAGPISFAVETDTAAIKGRLNDFVEAYNKVVNFVNTQNTYNEETGPGGGLFGDALLRSVRSQINSALFGLEQRQDIDLPGIIADTEGYTTLRAIGFETANDGTLSLDETVLDEKLAADPELFADLFVDSDGFDNGGAAVNTPGYLQDTSADAGIMAILDRAIERMFDTFDDGLGNTREGLFGARTKALQSTVDRYDDQIESRELRLESFRENLVKRFAALEELIGGLNAQGAALQQALLGLDPS